jgi:hypothetical protein
MPQMLRQDNIPRMLVASTTTATLATTSGGQATLVTIGGQQYTPASLLTLNAATVGANGLDAGSLGASQLWYVYAIAHQTSFAMALVASLSAIPTMPTGYGTAYKLIGAFNTNASSQISFTVTPEDGVIYPVNGANVTATISAANVGGPTTMDDVTATRLGLKVYVHGTTYNGGNAPTLTLTAGGGSLSVVNIADFIPYQTQSGTWRMRFSVNVYLSTLSRATATLAVAGVTAAGFHQGISGFFLASGCDIGYSYFVGSSNGMVAQMPAAFTTDEMVISGDIKLASKPTWAY